ncbi:MAG: type IX secretion system membrane protein PorP/SprF [Bacteroidales bacterium]|jgi:type IX secretion system PorP/SprF family membrane protein|nr:type IX secretion system membrane protein PorP/SprF [Bacteroidales bacterium]
MKFNIKRAVIATATSLSALFCSAQQDLMVSQQVFSRINVNPAGTGNNKGFDAFLLGRIQWAGVDNSPMTGVLNFTGYSENVKSSFGLTVNYDNIGVGNSQTNAQAVYAYHIDLNPKYILSLGISAGFNVGSFDPLKNTLKDESEVGKSTYVADKTTEISPDFNAGAEISNEHWLAGFSCTHMLNDTSTTFRKGRHFYIYGRGFFNITPSFDLAPLFSYMHKHNTNTTEIGCQAFFKKMIWGGVAWKPDLNRFTEMSMLSITAGFEWANRFRFGYSYDMNLGKYNNLPSNTHELMLSAHF